MMDYKGYYHNMDKAPHMYHKDIFHGIFHGSSCLDRLVEIRQRHGRRRYDLVENAHDYFHENTGDVHDGGGL